MCLISVIIRSDYSQLLISGRQTHSRRRQLTVAAFTRSTQKSRYALRPAYHWLKPFFRHVPVVSTSVCRLNNTNLLDLKTNRVNALLQHSEAGLSDLEQQYHMLVLINPFHEFFNQLSSWTKFFWIRNFLSILAVLTKFDSIITICPDVCQNWLWICVVWNCVPKSLPYTKIFTFLFGMTYTDNFIDFTQH